MQVRNEDRAEYRVARTTLDDDAIVARALEILTQRLRRVGDLLDSPSTVRDWLVLRYAALPHEEFGVIFLDARNRVLAAETLFRGTLTQASVYPREVVKAALQHNASAVIIFHNHPSGAAEPSGADELLTRNLKEALQLVDVRVLDHFIVAGAGKPLSFAERGLI